MTPAGKRRWAKIQAAVRTLNKPRDIDDCDVVDGGHEARRGAFKLFSRQVLSGPMPWNYSSTWTSKNVSTTGHAN